MTDPLLRTTSYTRDAVGRVTKETLPDLREVGMTYDAVGNVTSVTPPGRPAHGMTYTPVSLMASYDPPLLSSEPVVSTVYAYNFDRQIVHATRPDGGIVSWGYDSAGRTATITHPHGVITYGYHPTKGVLQSLSTGSESLAFAYDGALLTSQTWSGPVAGSVGFGYDARHRLSSETVNGGSPVSFGYDKDSLLTQAGAMTFARDVENGLLTGTTLGSVSDSYLYDAFGQVSEYRATSGSTELLKIVYTRDTLGRITVKTETTGGLTTAWGYRYDLAGRLDRVEKDGALFASYAYDGNGNRLSKTTPSSVESGTYDAQDRMLSYGGFTYTYTANGELKTKTETATGAVTTFEYDALGNLRKVTPPSGPVVEYVIDGRNRRVGKKVGGSLVQGFVYSNQLRIVAELDAAGSVVSRFVYGTKVNVPELMIRGGARYRLVTDHLGSVRKVVDASTGAVVQAIEYDEFGVVLSDSNPGWQPFGFAGGLVDASSGFVRFGARDYEARAGMWTTKDPIRFDGGLNLHAYAGGDPVNLIDPSGLLFTPPPPDAVAKVCTAAAVASGVGLGRGLAMSTAAGGTMLMIGAMGLFTPVGDPGSDAGVEGESAGVGDDDTSVDDSICSDGECGGGDPYRPNPPPGPKKPYKRRTLRELQDDPPCWDAHMRCLDDYLLSPGGYDDCMQRAGC